MKLEISAEFLVRLLKQTLGNPAAIRKNDKDDILIYEVGEYELKFVSPHDSKMLH